MSRLVVRVVGPSGRETYLTPTYAPTRETDDASKANLFTSEPCALLCADLYREANAGVTIVVDVIDLDDEETHA